MAVEATSRTPSLSTDAYCVVIGGSAAGLTAALTAARAGARHVVVLEGATRLGAKILISGGGRCNLTNRSVSAADFNGGNRRAIARVLHALPVDRTLALFRDLGVPVHEEARGKIFPDTNRARTVLDALVSAVQGAGVEIRASTRVDAIEPTRPGFRLQTARGTVTATQVVLATGGRSVPKTGSDGAGYGFATRLGHTIVETTPSLVPLLLDDAEPSLSGVSHEVELSLAVGSRVVCRVHGPLLWTHVGISGPAALDVSRHWHRARLGGDDVGLDLSVMPGISFDAIDRALVSRAAARPRAHAAAVLSDDLPASLADTVCSRAGVDPSVLMAHLPRETRRRIVHALREWRVAVRDSRGFNYAEATAGGVSLDEIDPATMESRACPGLFLTGEILDVDGRLGGFNFQWAWSSGYVAGRALARRATG
jgi:predicted Rossmann fold flavoprotein